MKLMASSACSLLTNIIRTMRKHFYWVFSIAVIFSQSLLAQAPCSSAEYTRNEIPFISTEGNYYTSIFPVTAESIQSRIGANEIVTIPVVVHILYHELSENISDDEVTQLITTLNNGFRRKNADTINTPDRFKPLAADCQIEFKLAISDPRRRGTTGIVRKYSPVTKWTLDDQMKYTDKGGDDAWDPSSYLNIWICKLSKTLGYASFPGGDKQKDGVALDFSAVRRKTIIHETGHWLGLKHIWGDEYCGDDGVDDTPKQGNFTSGCPSGIRSSCSNGKDGDMYMNYMDFTNDACINLFTKGQKEKMRSLFEDGALRSAILLSKGLQKPLISEIPIADDGYPKWLYANLYPNPTNGNFTMDLSYDVRWVGNYISITDIHGIRMLNKKIESKIVTMSIAHLKPGVYFVFAKREDGTTIKQKLIKM